MPPSRKSSLFSLSQALPQGLGQDFRFSFKLLISNPRLTLIATFTLALGIAVSATVFSWMDNVLLHPYPGVTDTRGLALLETVTTAGEHLAASSYIDYRDYRDNLKLISDIAIGRLTPLSIGSGENADRSWAELVSANYFDVLRVKPVLGRFFLPEEGAHKPGAFPVAVISYRMWQNRYGGARDVFGKVIRLNRHDLTIIGVAPPDFRGTTVGLVYDVWMPITMANEMGSAYTLTYRGCRDLTSTVVRLKPGVTLDQASDEIGALAKRLAATYPETNRGVDAIVVPVWAGNLGAQHLLLKPLQILAVVCALLLLLVCANVGNLLLARAVSRQKEFGLRLAFGARASRVIRQLLVETLALSAAAAALACLLLFWLQKSLMGLLPAAVDFPFDLRGGLNLRTLAFIVLIVMITTVACGMAPALISIRRDLNNTLNEGGRSGIGGTRSHRLRSFLVGVEVALAMVALVSAGLFLRSFHNASAIDPGFDTRNVSMSQFYLSNAGYTAEEQWAFCRRLRERLETAPGVTAVTYTDFVPLTSLASSPQDELNIEGYVPAPNEQMLLHRATVPPGYFHFMGIPMIDGRDFTELDQAGAPQVMIVNQTFAHHFFGSSTSVGRIVRFGSDATTIIAVVKDSKYNTPIETPTPFFYVPFRQKFAPALNFSVLIKTTGDPMAIIPTLRTEAVALNQDAYFRSSLLGDAITFSLYALRIAALLLTSVGVLCLLLSAIGLYSVTSYAVSQRRQEFGVRLALGASRFAVVRMVTRESLILTIPGLLAGITIALAAFRVFSTMLIGVTASDPVTFAASALFLLAITFLASILPATRAMQTDPMTALHCQ